MSMTRARKLRWAVFGTGRMADDFVRELLLNENRTVVGVASKNADRAAGFAQKHGISKAFGSYEKLLEATDPDVVYIATTSDQHFREACMCIALGKPVLVEKPICLRSLELDKLIALAREHRTFVMEAMWMRCFPLIRALKSHLRPIGPLRSVEASFCIGVPFDEENRLYAPSLGGGVLYDLGVYPINFIHLLLGLEPCDVEHEILRAPTGVDDFAKVSLSYPNGMSAAFECSLRTNKPHVAVIEGARGLAVLDDFFHPSRLAVNGSDGSEYVTVVRYPLKGYHYEIEEVEACVAAGKHESDLMPLAYSSSVLGFIERLLRESQ